MNEQELMAECRSSMNKVLVILRELRRRKTPGSVGGRELSEAITHFETGCMWMIRSIFAEEGEYSPLLKLKKSE